jgi:hypothetical protein
MSTVTGGPKIVKSGLILDLDASSANSYGPIKAEVLVVAGGGAGGGYHGGGGGGGGVLYTSNYTIVRNTTYTVTVGQGGAGANSTSNTGDPGENSIFSGASTVLTAVGGGAGKSQGNATQARNNGGSGGGGCDGNSSSITGGSGTAAQGFNGGDVSAESGAALAVYYGTAGGGGAGGVGGTGGIVNGGFGGPGLPFSISGTSQYYGGGGGGTNLTNILTYGLGGIGGGGTGGVSPSPHNSPLRYSTSGSANTGGGGGGYLYSGNGGGSGGSGIVIIRYKGPQKATGGTITTVGTETVHTFTSSGTFVTGTNFIDLSGNRNNGTINGATFNSANGGSIVFNGSSQYVSVSSLITGNQSFSWGAWIYPIATGTPVFFGNVSTGLAMLSYWDSANNKVRVGTYGADRLTSGTAILPSTWGYTFWTWDGTTLISYTNGIADGTATGFSFNISNLYTTIGNSVNAQYFAGRIAQTLVYNRVLSAAEIMQNYQAVKTRFGL